MPAIITDAIPWSRFWVPFGGELTLDRDGFLPDPEQPMSRLKNKALVTTLNLPVAGIGFLALHGEPAMGKTFAIGVLETHVRAQETPGADVWGISCADLPSELSFNRYVLDSVRWNAWKAGTGQMTFFLDGVDEGQLKISGLVGHLALALKNEPIDRLRLVVACRSLDWPQNEGPKLAGLWKKPASEVAQPDRWELCPLRRCDVLTVAARQGLDGKAFLQAIHRGDVGALAARPMTLLMLVRHFKQGAQTLPSHRELYRQTTLDLCREPDGDRRDRLKLREAPERLRRVGERIAALLLICKRSCVYLGPRGTEAPNELEVADIAGGEETVGDVTFEITEDLVRQTLKTGLFTAALENRARFPQQTYAESLGADYLKNLPLAQIRSLLCADDGYGDYVQPPLRQLASWIAGMVPEFFSLLLEIDPDTLLRADMAHVPNDQKRRLLVAVLERADQEELFHDYGTHRHYAALAFPGVAEVLRPYLIDRKRNGEVRRIALGVARECRLRAMLPDLLRILDDPTDPSFHGDVAFALFAFIGPADRPRLLPLLRLGPEALGARPRFGIVMSMIRSGVWTLRQALPLVPELLATEPFNHSHSLAGLAEPGDVGLLLESALHWPDAFDALSPYHGLVEAAYDLGLKQLDNPKIRRLFGKAWLAALNHGQFSSSNSPALAEALKHQPDRRRALLTELIELPWGPNAMEPYQIIGLADRVADFDYFLQELSSLPKKRLAIHARFLADLYDPEKHTSSIEQLLDLVEQNAVLRAQFPRVREWRLDDPVTVDMRRQHREYKQRQAEWAARRARPMDPPTVWVAALEEGKKNTNEGWFQVAVNLFYGDDAHRNSNDFDLTASAGWSALGPEGQAIVRQAARAFLLRQHGDPLAAKGKVTQETQCAYRAIYLLRAEIETNPELRRAVVAHWLPLYYLDILSTDSVRSEMAELACRLDPKSKMAPLRRILAKRFAHAHHHIFELRHFQKIWDGAMSRALNRFLTTQKVPAEMVESALEFLSDADPAAGKILAEQILSQEKLPRQQAVALWAWLLLEFLVPTWPAAAKAFGKDPNLAKAVLSRMAGSYRDMQWPQPEPAAAPVLAAFSRALRTAFPYRSDPPFSGGVQKVTSRMDAARLRDETITAIAGSGTLEACQQMELIASQAASKQRNWMHSYFQKSLVAMRQLRWESLSPEEVKTTAAKHDRRMLRSDSDLARLILESLLRLEDSLQRTKNSGIRYYWRESEGNGGATWRPKGEVESASNIVNWLQNDLAKEITVFREVSVQWTDRTDIEVMASAIEGRKLRPLSVTIEVKGAWHRDVATAAGPQLAKRYLLGTGRRAGIYLVLWTHCAASKGHPCRLRARDLAAARKEVVSLVNAAREAHPTLILEAAVLDLTLPDAYLAKGSRTKQVALQPRRSRRPTQS